MENKWILDEILRIGKKAIISFPNFGYWLCRVQLAFKGRMPITKDLKLHWYDTQNIHLCTVKDFYDLIKEMDLNIEEEFGINGNKILKNPFISLFLNLFASHAVFLVSRQN